MPDTGIKSWAVTHPGRNGRPQTWQNKKRQILLEQACLMPFGYRGTSRKESLSVLAFRPRKCPAKLPGRPKTWLEDREARDFEFRPEPRMGVPEMQKCHPNDNAMPDQIQGQL